MALSHSDIARIYRERFSREMGELQDTDIQYRVLKHHLGRFEGKNPIILDAGCGDGKYSKRLLTNGYTVHSVDLYRNKANHRGLNFYCASIDSLPFKENTFDLVASISVIFYLEEPEKGIREFARVLKEGGYLYLTAHTKYSLFTLIRRFKRMCGLKSLAHLKGVRFFSTAEYVNMLRKNNFEIVHVDGYRLSIFFYPAYKKLSKLLQKLVNVSLPLYHQSMEPPKVLAGLRAVFGYHSIIVARKKS